MPLQVRWGATVSVINEYPSPARPPRPRPSPPHTVNISFNPSSLVWKSKFTTNAVRSSFPAPPPPALSAAARALLLPAALLALNSALLSSSTGVAAPRFFFVPAEAVLSFVESFLEAELVRCRWLGCLHVYGGEQVELREFNSTRSCIPKVA